MGEFCGADAARDEPEKHGGFGESVTPEPAVLAVPSQRKGTALVLLIFLVLLRNAARQSRKHFHKHIP